MASGTDTLNTAPAGTRPLSNADTDPPTGNTTELASTATINGTSRRAFQLDRDEIRRDRTAHQFGTTTFDSIAERNGTVGQSERDTPNEAQVPSGDPRRTC